MTGRGEKRKAFARFQRRSYW